MVSRTLLYSSVPTFGPAVYKVETVGAVYVVSAGVPEPRTDHCKARGL